MLFLAVTCTNPPVDSNASRSAWLPTLGYIGYNASITYQCNNGYWYSSLMYQSTITCNETGTWSPVYELCSGILATENHLLNYTLLAPFIF